MATMQRGITLGANDEVTNTKLHNLVDLGTITNIGENDFASGMSPVIKSTSAPSNTNAIWIDTANNLVKVYLGSGWIELPTELTPASGEYLYHNGTNWVGAGISTGGVLGSYKNLKVVRTNVTTVTVTADELVLEDSSNNKVTIRSVSEAIAITTAGASGLDTGSEGSSRWYYIWIIRKSSDGTVNGLLSESSSSPTMPSGYDQKALVSAVYNSSGSDFVDFTHKGKRYSYVAWRTLASGNVGATWTSIDTTAFVPSALAENGFGSFSNASGLGITNDSSVNAAIGTAAPNKFGIPGTVATGQHYWELDILTANTLYWISGAAGDIVYIGGFEVTKL